MTETIQTINGNAQNSPSCSIYKNIYDKTGKYTIKILDALNRIKTGKTAKVVISLRNEANEDRQKVIKDSCLPSVCFSGIFESRFDEKLIKHSGFICLDFDKINVAEYKEKLSKWECCYAVWVSPRGNGIKVLVKIKDGSKHRQHFAALRKLYPDIDEKCGNESRVCYESYDPDIYINENSLVYEDILEEKNEIKEKKPDINRYDSYKKLVKWMENKGEIFNSGNRNNYVFLLAGGMCRFGFSEEEANEYLLEDFMQDGFNHKEITATIHSAYKKNSTKFNSIEFSTDKTKLQSRDEGFEIDPKIFEEGFKPQDIIYGSDVYDGAIGIYTNGYSRAETTHINKLDDFFKFKKGELTVLSGIGNYGKSNYLYQLLLIKSYFKNDKWAIFSPEHFPAEEFFHDATETMLGCPADGGYFNKPPREKYDAAYEFVSKHFAYIYPETISPTPEYIKTKFLESIIKDGTTGVVIDPFNQLSNDYGRSGRSDKYLETFLSDCKHFAQINNVFFIIVCHPHKLQKMTNGNYPCPDIFDLADGAMWNNKADNILIYHRPVAQTDPDNPICEHHSKKIKRQKQVGKRGWFEFELKRKQRRFLFDGKSPLEGNIYEHKIFEQEQPNQVFAQEKIETIDTKYFYEKDEDIPF